jgi:hypothetical protein
MTDQQTQPFAEWAILELLGHRRIAGHLQETTIAGHGFLRLDIPATDGHTAQTQYIAPGSIYALHPVDEKTARAAATAWRPQPVQRWELPAADPDPEIDEADVWRESRAAL